MKLLILPPRYTPDSIALWRAAIERGWTPERLQSWSVPEELRGQPAVIYGEPLFALAVAEALGARLLEPPADWIANLPEIYRGRDVQFTTLERARCAAFPRFIKPAVEKCFPAAVYDSADGLPAPGIVPESTPVLCAEPVHWEAEYRCFVLDRRIMTSSVYFRDGELAQAEDGGWPMSDPERQAVERLAGQVLADASVTVPEAVVMDVGVIAGQGSAVLELNAAWGSGIYGCDPQKVLTVIERGCWRRKS